MHALLSYIKTFFEYKKHETTLHCEKMCQNVTANSLKTKKLPNKKNYQKKYIYMKT